MERNRVAEKNDTLFSFRKGKNLCTIEQMENFPINMDFTLVVEISACNSPYGHPTTFLDDLAWVKYGSRKVGLIKHWRPSLHSLYIDHLDQSFLIDHVTILQSNFSLSFAKDRASSNENTDDLSQQGVDFLYKWGLAESETLKMYCSVIRFGWIYTVLCTFFSHWV